VSRHAAGEASATGNGVTVTGARITLGLLLFAAIWLLVLSATTRVAPADNIEQLNWVRSMEWGYYKHPPLPTWLLGALVWLFGRSATLTYLLGAGCTLSSMALLWRFLSRVRGPHYATITLLAALCITYYNDRLQFFNHNVVLMLATTCSALLAHAAMTRSGIRWWVGLGLALGLGTLAKYQMAVTGLCLLTFWISQGGWKSREKRIGLAVSVLVALLVVTPHLYWLTTHNYEPIHYAISTSLGEDLGASARLTSSAGWLANQVLNRALPAWLLLLIAAAPWRKPSGRSSAPRAGIHDGAGALLVSWGAVPLAFTFLLGLTTGAELQAQWGTPFMLFVVPAAMELLGWTESSARQQTRRALIGFVGLQALLVLFNLLTSPFGPPRWRSQTWESFDAAKLARQVAPAARLALGGPIRVVAGERARAGAFSLDVPEHPLVLIDGNYAYSPWVSRDLVARCGALRIGPKSELPQGTPVGVDFPNLAWEVIRRDAQAAPCD
jgi:4-amino-4-deoxy-L-arabinose transferase-like glycosyltransferase